MLRRYLVAYSVNKPDWRTWMTTNSTDSIALLAANREIWMCKFCWCWYHIYETMKVDSSKNWAKKKVNMSTGPQLEKEKALCEWPWALHSVMVCGWLLKEAKLFSTKLLLSEKHKLKSYGIQQTLRWNNILLSVSKKVNPLKISQSQIC